MKKKKTIVKFLIKFFITYGLLVLIYSLYLDRTQQREDVFSCAPITETVAKQTVWLGNVLGFDTSYKQHPAELSLMFFVGEEYSSRIVEGCNAISVIILFIAFIIAFEGSLKYSILYSIAGAAILYVVNLFRVLLLGILYVKYPEYEYFFHSLLFPAIIYGAVFLLWIIWVNKFSYLKKPKREKAN